MVSLSARTVEGAAQSGAAFSLFQPVVLDGTFLAWLLRSKDRVPEMFPIPGEWRFVLFGFTAIQFARHPEGMIEFGKRRATAKRNERLFARDAERAAAATGVDASEGAA